MLDTIRIKIPIKTPEEFFLHGYEPFTFMGYTFKPNSYYKKEFPTTYSCSLGNLKLTMIGGNLLIDNSLHKFLKGNNYSPFYFSDINECVDILGDTLGMNIREGDVKKIAYGCVVKEQTGNLYKNWNYYKGEEFLPMRVNYTKGKQYGNRCDLTDYCIKAYNKTVEVKRHNEIILDDTLLRYEIEAKYMKYLTNRKKQIPIFKVKDILKKDNWNLLVNDLLLKYSIIEKTVSMDLSKLRPHQINVLATMRNKDLREHLKANHSKTYKRYKTIYKNLSKQAENESYHSVIGERIKDKCEELLNS